MANPVTQASQNCGTCNGQGQQPNGCPDCHGTTPYVASTAPVATTQASSAPPSRTKTVLKVLGAVALLGLLLFGVSKIIGFDKPSSTSSAAANAPATTASAVAKSDAAPDCPDGTLWDTKRKVCVERAVPAPMTFPSSIAIQLPCPSNCPQASPPPVVASAGPAPTPTYKPKPFVAPAKFDLSEIGNPQKFPPGE